MDIKTVVGEIHKSDADTIIVYLFEGAKLAEQSPGNAAKSVSDALNGAISELSAGGDFVGKSGQVAVLYPRGAIPARRVVIVGLGERDKFTVDTARRAVAQGLQKARELKSDHAATVTLGTDVGGLSVGLSAQAVTEGALLGLYNYHGKKSTTPPDDLPKTLTIFVYGKSDLKAGQQGAQAGVILASAANFTRDLVNTPPNICSPSYLAQQAQLMAGEVGLNVEVLEEKQMQALKMGALLAVSQGSDNSPRFIILEHNPKRVGKGSTVVLVGKGVTFDTGGYSIKTSEGMVGMKADMAGAAAVIGAMQAIAALKVNLHVVGLVPTAENMINGHSYRPQDVVTASNGKTIEIISTDAEGRMLLADALVYAARYKPTAVVDIATLTGACVTALGNAAAGFFCTSDQLRDKLLAAAEATQEKLWQLPLFAEYEKAIESQAADIKNTGGRNTGVGTSATFLKHFTDYPAWAHIDMAGVMADLPGNSYVPTKGASGYGARLLAEFVQQWAQGG